MMIHADTSLDAENRLGVDIMARKVNDVDVNDMVGTYSFFGHWLNCREDSASVGWGTLDVNLDGSAVATWVEQDGAERTETLSWSFDDVNGIVQIPGEADGLLCTGGIICSFTSSPDAEGDLGYNFFVKESNEPITPNDIAGTYVVRYFDTSVSGQPFTCNGTLTVRTNGTWAVDNYFSDGDHAVSDGTYTIGPGNKMTIYEQGQELSKCIISPDKSLIFLPEYQVPLEPQPCDWIGGISNVRTVYNIADLNENKCVDFVDYATFAKQWLKPEGTLSADFNDDSQVDWLDLRTLANNWLWNANWYTP